MFSNTEAVERFDQAHGAKIEKMYWIASSLGNSDLKDFIESMADSKGFKKCLPEIANMPHFKKYLKDDDILQAFIDKDKFGLVAEISIPIAKDFNYHENGKIRSWSANGSHCRVDYVYAETLDLLLAEIEKSAESHFKEFIKEDKKNRSKLSDS